MRIFTDLDNLPFFKNTIVTIGSFDGVHAGHQYILKVLKDQATLRNSESVLITFEPHPRLLIEGNQSTLKLLTDIEEKSYWLNKYEIDNLIIVPFNQAFSNQSPEVYIKKFLVHKFNPQVLIIGYDHHFGHKRKGNIEYLHFFSSLLNFEVIEIKKQLVDDIAVSSTKIRKAIESGNMQKAALLLNHAFSIIGKVVKGKQIGRTIGFPTANIEVSSSHKIIPAVGIYAVYINHNNVLYKGMLYIGTRPTIDNSTKRSIEVHIFDFDKTIYGDTLHLFLFKYIRSDQRFDSLEEMTEQLKRDQIKSLYVLE